MRTSAIKIDFFMLAATMSRTDALNARRYYAVLRALKRMRIFPAGAFVVKIFEVRPSLSPGAALGTHDHSGVYISCVVSPRLTRR